MTYFAHSGHWAISALEASPFFIMLVWLIATTWRERRREEREARDEKGGTSG